MTEPETVTVEIPKPDPTRETKPDTILNVAAEVVQERQRQDKKWGVQDHPNGTGPKYKGSAFRAKVYCDTAFKNGIGTWKHVLDEEVQEAFAEDDPERLREELIQVAAVAQAWVEAIDRGQTRE